MRVLREEVSWYVRVDPTDDAETVRLLTAGSVSLGPWSEVEGVVEGHHVSGASRVAILRLEIDKSIHVIRVKASRHRPETLVDVLELTEDEAKWVGPEIVKD